MTDFRTGWAPAGRIRQPITLPEALDHEVTVRAKKHHVPPNVYVGQLLGQGVTDEKTWKLETGPVESGRKVQRIVLLDRSVYSAINNRVSSTNHAFSDVAAKIVKSVIHANGNGTGSLNGHG